MSHGIPPQSPDEIEQEIKGEIKPTRIVVGRRTHPAVIAAAMMGAAVPGRRGEMETRVLDDEPDSDRPKTQAQIIADEMRHSYSPFHKNPFAVEKSRALPAGRQWIGHDAPGGAAAARRKRQQEQARAKAAVKRARAQAKPETGFFTCSACLDDHDPKVAKLTNDDALVCADCAEFMG